MRFIAYGDVHFSSTYRGLTLEDFVEIEEMIAAEARKEPDTVVLFLGDRFLSRAPSYRDIEASERGLAAFEGLPFIALVGNHDRLSKSISSEHTLMHWMTGRYPNVTVLDKTGWTHFDGYSIFAIPAGQFPQVDKIENEVSEGNIGICLFHDLYQNSMVHASGKRLEGTATDIMDKSFFSMVLGGDNHVPQDLLFKNTRGWHLGAPLQMNWGDKGINRGFWEYEVDKSKSVVEKFHDTNKPQFYDISISARDIDDAMEQLEFQQRCGNFHEDDILRIEVTCEKESEITKNALETEIVSELKPRHVEVILDFKHKTIGAEMVRTITKMSPEARFSTYLKLRGIEEADILTQLLTDLNA